MVDVKIMAITFRDGKEARLLCSVVSPLCEELFDMIFVRVNELIAENSPHGLAVYEGKFSIESLQSDIAAFSPPSGSFRDASWDDVQCLFTGENPFVGSMPKDCHVFRAPKPSELCRTTGVQACYRCDDKNCGDNQAKAPVMDVDSVEFFKLAAT